jgi:23S rRNA (adenine2503-C2)-methyltransferase
MIAEINDSPQDAKKLLKILKDIPSKINLIPLNEAQEIPFKRPSDEKIKRFQEILMEGGVTAIIRTSKGEEISAACGQLRGKSLE